MTNPKKGGAARKAPEGLNVPIYLRGDQALVDALDRIKDARNAANPGTTLSRADVARGILWYGIRLDADAADESTPKRGRKGAKS